ncbi:hypothetical protein NLJ89_g9306 [Agrocybe chaxingu]|uniref:BTB domain-containing protein n=1 Tax=Agrocybe chaxingu TaxID=84603 RepID=A0A9W8K0U3_9AGAR|nr:hypothetical protein NLJ89_g9306 [Agrocybe chaxingu]
MEVVQNRRISIGRREDIVRGEPWFKDGNIVLVTHDEPTAFRLHRGVLERHSEIFKDMLGLPQTEESDTLHFEGCQVVMMHDQPQELSNLVMALYDGPKFANAKIDDFFYLSGILRLANKYFIGRPSKTPHSTHFETVILLNIARPSAVQFNVPAPSPGCLKLYSSVLREKVN